MRPVFEQHAPAIDEPIEGRAVVGAEAAPRGQVVRALDDVDRVDLEPAGVGDERFEVLSRRAAGRAVGRGRCRSRNSAATAFARELGTRRLRRTRRPRRLPLHDARAGGAGYARQHVDDVLDACPSPRACARRAPCGAGSRGSTRSTTSTPARSIESSLRSSSRVGHVGVRQVVDPRAAAAPIRVRQRRRPRRRRAPRAEVVAASARAGRVPSDTGRGRQMRRGPVPRAEASRTVGLEQPDLGQHFGDVADAARKSFAARASPPSCSR